MHRVIQNNLNYTKMRTKRKCYDKTQCSRFDAITKSFKNKYRMPLVTGLKRLSQDLSVKLKLKRVKKYNHTRNIGKNNRILKHNYVWIL